MKTTAFVRVGLPTSLYNTIRTAAKRTETSVAGLARAAIQRFIPKMEPVRLKRPARRFNQLQMKR